MYRRIYWKGRLFHKGKVIADIFTSDYQRASETMEEAYKDALHKYKKKDLSIDIDDVTEKYDMEDLETDYEEVGRENPFL